MSRHLPVRLPGFVDERRVTRYQYAVVTLCGLVMFLDGFDTQAISFMAPHIAADWGLQSAALGPVFSAALVGLMIGYLVLSPLSERFGHRRVIIGAAVIFGVTTLGTAGAENVTELLVLRLLAGIGLGAAAPSAVTLTGEFSPKRLRASFVLAIYCGFSVGFAVAGPVSGWLIPAHGWRIMPWVGALAPFLLVPVLLKWLPESPLWLVKQGTDAGIDRAYGTLRRIGRELPERPAKHDGPVVVLDEPDGGSTRAALSALVTRKQIVGTVLLWLVFMINLGEFYALQSWLPTMLSDLGDSNSVVVTATTLTTVGGIAAAFVTGPAMDRLGAFATLAVLYGVGFVFVALTGVVLHSPVWLLLTATFLAGVSVSGGQKSLIALAAVYYPAAIRSTGVGWALGIGRVGGILGPLAVGTAIGAGWSASAVFYALSVPMLLAGLVVLRLGARDRTRSDRGPVPEPTEPAEQPAVTGH